MRYNTHEISINLLIGEHRYQSTQPQNTGKIVGILVWLLLT